jgi:hypothetical protein
MSSVEIPQFQLKRTAQKKGPAEVAASPSHGPAALEKTMNEKDASTTAPAMANRAPIFDLENPTLELERFASILSDLTDDLFNRNHRKPGGLDGMIMVKTRDSALDDIEFIVSKVYGLANQIGDATTRAINAQVAAEGGGAVAGGPAIARLVARLKGGESPMEIAHVAADLARGAAA